MPYVDAHGWLITTTEAGVPVAVCSGCEAELRIHGDGFDYDRRREHERLTCAGARLYSQPYHVTEALHATTGKAA